MIVDQNEGSIKATFDDIFRTVCAQDCLYGVRYLEAEPKRCIPIKRILTQSRQNDNRLIDWNYVSIGPNIRFMGFHGSGLEDQDSER